MKQAIRDFIAKKDSMSKVEAREKVAELNADIRSYLKEKEK